MGCHGDHPEPGRMSVERHRGVAGLAQTDARRQVAPVPMAALAHHQAGFGMSRLSLVIGFREAAPENRFAGLGIETRSVEI